MSKEKLMTKLLLRFRGTRKITLYLIYVDYRKTYIYITRYGNKIFILYMYILFTSRIWILLNKNEKIDYIYCDLKLYNFIHDSFFELKMINS